MSYFIQVIILQHMFVNKGKINTARFFHMLQCIIRDLQKNLNIIWQPTRFTPPPFFILPYPPFPANIFRPPPLISINSENVIPPLYEGSSNYVLGSLILDQTIVFTCQLLKTRFNNRKYLIIYVTEYECLRILQSIS